MIQLHICIYSVSVWYVHWIHLVISITNTRILSTPYLDMSVLLLNMLLVNFIWNYIRDTSDIFSISSLVKISLTFLCFLSSFFIFETLISMQQKEFKCTLAWTYEVYLLMEKNFTTNLFFPLEVKLHMFVPPCSIVYVLQYVTHLF